MEIQNLLYQLAICCIASYFISYADFVCPSENLYYKLAISFLTFMLIISCTTQL